MKKQIVKFRKEGFTTFEIAEILEIHPNQTTYICNINNLGGKWFKKFKKQKEEEKIREEALNEETAIGYPLFMTSYQIKHNRKGEIIHDHYLRDKYDIVGIRKKLTEEEREQRRIIVKKKRKVCECPMCGEEFETILSSRKKYCGKKCVSLAIKKSKTKYHTEKERKAAGKIRAKRHYEKVKNTPKYKKMIKAIQEKQKKDPEFKRKRAIYSRMYYQKRKMLKNN